MTSNEKLEDLLRKLYAEEPHKASPSEQEMQDIIDEEWQKFEAQQFDAQHYSLFTIHYSLKKIAAVFVGILLLSGISYAAIRIVKSTNRTEVVEDLQSETAESRIYNPQSTTEPADSTLTAEPKTFENVPLKDIVQEMVAYYRASVDIKNTDAAGLRLYYPWNPQMPLTQVVEELNRFEKVKLTLKDNQIIIE